MATNDGVQHAASSLRLSHPSPNPGRLRQRHPKRFRPGDQRCPGVLLARRPWFGAGLISGANADVLTASLGTQDFACSNAQTLPASITQSTTVITQWTCARDDGDVKYNLTISGDDASHLHDLNAVALFLEGQSLADMNKDWFLPFMAELSYNGAQPAQVKTWLAQSSSEPLVITGVNFLLSGSNNYLGLRIFGAE